MLTASRMDPLSHPNTDCRSVVLMAAEPAAAFSSRGMMQNLSGVWSDIGKRAGGGRNAASSSLGGSSVG